MKHLLLSFLLSSSIFGQQNEERDALVGALFEARDVPSFEKAYSEAEDGNVPEQILVEAKFLHLVDNADRATLAAFAPTLKAQLEKNTMTDSVIFAVREDFMAVLEYTLALDALEKKDSAGFKKHITEAFWLSPSQSAVFGPHIDEHRLAEKMALIKMNFDQKFEIQSAPKETASLKALLGDAPAIALHFWTPWAQESANSIPDYLATADILEKHKIPSASLLISGNAQSRIDATSFLAELKENLPGSWLVDNEKKRLSNLLRVSNFPTIALVSKDGSVLFNGNPGSNDFWKELKKIVPKIERPKSPLLDPTTPNLIDSDPAQKNE